MRPPATATLLASLVLNKMKPKLLRAVEIAKKLDVLGEPAEDQHVSARAFSSKLRRRQAKTTAKLSVKPPARNF